VIITTREGARAACVNLRNSGTNQIRPDLSDFNDNLSSCRRRPLSSTRLGFPGFVLSQLSQMIGPENGSAQFGIAITADTQQSQSALSLVLLDGVHPETLALGIESRGGFIPSRNALESLQIAGGRKARSFIGTQNTAFTDEH
jgi:hypothetical protein